MQKHKIRDIVSRDASRLARSLSLPAAESRLEVRILLEHVLGVDRAWLLTHDGDQVTLESQGRYDALLARRLAGVPIAYIVGQREFYGRPFKVGPSVLIPRPETELLVDLAKSRLPANEACDVLDLGTGSGCIAISLALECPAWRVTGIERSQLSLDLARENAYCLRAQVELRQGEWFADLADSRFDLIVSNPPYIAELDPHLWSGDVRFEPREALVSGPGGMSDLNQIIRQSRDFLKPGGWLLIEHGWDQGRAVEDLMKQLGFWQVQGHQDHGGRDRATTGRCR